MPTEESMTGGISVEEVKVGSSLLDRVLDPDAAGRIGEILGESAVDQSRLAAPLLMMPLRLEYRIVEAGSKLELAQANPYAGEGRAPFLRSRRSYSRTEIWFRWYLDDPFANAGVAPISREEASALEAFRTAIAGAAGEWFNTEVAEIASAWRTLATVIEPARALYLIRHEHDITEESWHDQIGRLTAPPPAVALYAMTNGELSEIAVGRNIGENVRYSPAALKGNDWLTSFEAASRAGMALRLSSSTRVKKALAADWIIAVGVDPDADANVDVTSWLSDRMANDRLRFLSQDTPTNNSATVASGYDSGERDVLAHVEASSHAARGEATTRTDATRLATALGVSSELLHEGHGAGQSDVQDALDMARLLVPGLVSQLFEDNDFDLNRDVFSEFVIENVIGRGALPALRLGHSPYGILPICDPTIYQPPRGQSDAVRAAWDFVRQVGGGYSAAQSELTDQVQRIEPGGENLGESMAALLQSNPVSTRIDLGEAEGSSQNTALLGCAYVDARDWEPATYLLQLATTAVQDLPNPDRSDRAAPLLYRLIRLSREQLAARFPRAGTKLPLDADSLKQNSMTRTARTRLGQFRDAAERLAGRNTADLEVLMMEVIDAFTWRADAWVTALGHARLQLQRDAGLEGIRAGYYGFIGKLRSERATGGSDGYYQAPSVPQAVSTALLRSAHLRYRDEGAFDINLSSARLRKALGLMRWLRRGLNLREALGQRAERWLHDEQHDALILPLREAFPLRFGYRSRIDRPHLVDGMKVLDSRAPRGFSADQKAVFDDLKAMLAELLDALNDVVMAEAVHQLANGNTGAANAWTKVLSGDPIPERLQFVRTPVTGAASTHRVSTVLEHTPTAQHWYPRNVAEPALEALAQRELGDDLKAWRVAVSIHRGDTGASATIQMNLWWELRLHPVDLVVGGSAELQRRIIHRALWRWSTGHAWYAALGELPRSGLREFAEQTCSWNIDQAPALAELMEKASVLRKAVRGRALEPEDLNAAVSLASADNTLTDSDRLTLLEDMNASLLTRITRLSQLAVMRVRQLDWQIRRAEVAVAEVQRLQEAATSEEELATAEQLLNTRVSNLQRYLYEISRFGLPQALTWLGPADMVADWSGATAVLQDIRDRIAGHRDRAQAAVAETADATVEAQKTLLANRIAHLRALTDGDGMPIWPDFAPIEATKPTLAEDTELAEQLSSWQNVRGNLRAVSSWVAPGDLRAFASNDDATIPVETPDPDDPAPRDEQDRPLARYYGHYIDPGAAAEDAFVTSRAARVCGWVADEWSELRPSRLQDTGVAVSYDQPQSEPPHALLLGIAPHDGFLNWTNADAASVVAEAIRLLQVRAVPARLGAFELLGPRFFGVVPPTSDAKDAPDRIPVRTLRPGLELEGLLATGILRTTRPSVADIATSLHERTRRT